MGSSSSKLVSRETAAALAADIALFDAVAQAGSLALAAERLNLNEGTVARRLKAFESCLGLALFYRGPNRLTLTVAGAGLAEDAQSLAVAAERFAARAAAAKTLSMAPVRITATTSISLLLTRYASEISAAAGGAEIAILSTRQVLDLARGEADLALRMGATPDESGYFRQKLATVAHTLYVCCGVDALTAPIVSVSRETSSRLDDRITEWAAGRPITARVGDSAARYESVRSSGAVSMVPCFLGDADPHLIRLEDPLEETADELYLVSHAISRTRPAVARVAQALRALFKDQHANLSGAASVQFGSRQRVW